MSQFAWTKVNLLVVIEDCTCSNTAVLWLERIGDALPLLHSGVCIATDAKRVGYEHARITRLSVDFHKHQYVDAEIRRRSLDAQAVAQALVEELCEVGWSSKSDGSED
jgi:hypothetical protein